MKGSNILGPDEMDYGESENQIITPDVLIGQEVKNEHGDVVGKIVGVIKDKEGNLHANVQISDSVIAKEIRSAVSDGFGE